MPTRAGGDVIIGKIDAGDYLATAEDAAALRLSRSIADDALFTSLTDTDGVGEVSLGLHVLQAAAPAGGVSITAAGSLLVGAATAGGAGQPLALTAASGALEVRELEGVAPGLHSAGEITVNAASDVALAGHVTADGMVSVISAGSVRATAADLQWSAGGGLSIDAQSAIALQGSIAASDAVTIVSHGGDVAVPVDIHAQSGSTLDEISLAADGNLTLAGGRLAPVTTRLSLVAGAELFLGVTPPAWVVTGADGELHVSAGGDLLFQVDSVLQADQQVTLASTGYVDDQGDAQGGTLSLIATPRGYSTAAPRQVVLQGEDYLHLQPNVSAANLLKLNGGRVTLSRTGILWLGTDAILTEGGASPNLLGALAGSTVTLAAPNLELADGTTLILEQSSASVDQLSSPNPIVFTGGAVGVEVPEAAHVTLAHVFTGPGGLRKQGPGVLVLSAANTYTGATGVADGTLLVTGSTAADSAVSVNKATIGGTGTIQGVLTIGDDGRLIVGTEPNQIAGLNVGSLTFQSGSTLELEIGGAAAGRDQLAVTGSVTIETGAAVVVTGLNGFAPQPGVEYPLILNDGTADEITGRFKPAEVQNELGEKMLAGLLYSGGDGNDVTLIAALEYGDAPAPYPTLSEDDGARHAPVGPALGTHRDVEMDGVPSANADGDDTDATDDEDGVTFLSTIVVDATAATRASIQVDLQSADALSNRLDAWIDFNRDGAWDATEKIIDNYDLGTASGMVTVPFTIPQDTGANVQLGDTFARFRLSTAGNLLPTGDAGDGEVEDYRVTLAASGSPVTVAVPDQGSDELKAANVNGMLTVTQGDTVLFRSPAAGAGPITITGGEGDDILTLDFDPSNPIPVGGLTFDGGGGNDSLQLVNVPASFTTHTYTYANASDGRVVLDDGTNTHTVDFQNIEPIVNSGNVTYAIFDLPAGGNPDVTLSDVSPGTNLLLNGSTFEQTNFQTPAADGSIAIHLGGGDDGITINSATLNDATDVSIDGQAGTDSVHLGAAGGADGHDVVITVLWLIYDFTLAGYAAPEGNSTHIVNLVQVTRSGQTAVATSVDVVLTAGTAVPGSDFTAGPIPVDFAVGETVKTVPVSFLGDEIVERNETLGLSLANFTLGGRAGTAHPTAVLTIANDDAATISIDDVAHSEGDSGTTAYVFTVTLDAAVDTGVTVGFTTTDGSAEDEKLEGDYQSTAGILNFAGQAGETQTITVQVAGDTVLEPDEDFFVNLTALLAGGRNVTLADNQGRGEIRMDEPADNLVTLTGGRLTTPGEVHEYQLDLTAGPADGVYSLQVWDHQQSGFNPAAVGILDAQGNPVPVLQAVANATADGPSRSAVVVRLQPGQYRIRVQGENDTTGPYRLDVRLPGASGGERIVPDRNLQRAEAAMLQQEFGFNHVAQELFGQRLGIDLSVDQFRFEFDANQNGRMDATDMDAIVTNTANGSPLASVASLTRLGRPWHQRARLGLPRLHLQCRRSR